MSKVDIEESSSEEKTKFESNREKYLDKGFEDEAGDCKVCGCKYKSYFGHISE